MSKKKKGDPSKGFTERTTMGPGVTITPPADPPTLKHYVGSDHAPTEEEALEMGRALFDAIASEQARNARQADPE